MKYALLLFAAILSAGLRTDADHRAPTPRTFIFMVGDKRGGRETFTRGADYISGDITLGKQQAHYEGRIATDGTIPRLELRLAGRSISMTVGPDSTVVIERRGRTADTLRPATARGTLPLFDPSVGLYEIVIARARLAKARTATVPAVKIDADELGAGPRRPLESFVSVVPAEITFFSADSVMLGNTREKDKVRASISTDGRIHGIASGSDARDRFSARESEPRR